MLNDIISSLLIILIYFFSCVGTILLIEYYKYHKIEWRYNINMKLLKEIFEKYKGLVKYYVNRWY